MGELVFKKVAQLAGCDKCLQVFDSLRAGYAQLCHDGLKSIVHLLGFRIAVQTLKS